MQKVNVIGFVAGQFFKVIVNVFLDAVLHSYGIQFVK